MLRIIVTENTNKLAVKTLAKNFFPDGFTILKGKGFWGDTSEKSLLLLVAGEISPATIKAFCNQVNIFNNQECVMVIELPGEVSFI